jgi:hypothetical protein
MFSNSTMRFLEEVVEVHSDKPWGDVIAGSFYHLATFLVCDFYSWLFNRMRGGG